MTHLRPAAYLEYLRADLARIDELLLDAPAEVWERQVPTCPRWDVARLVSHLGAVHRMVIQALEAGQPSRSGQNRPPEGTDLLAWVAESSTRLFLVLDGDPDRQVWSFLPDRHTLGFWQRRQAHEHVVHRVDVELAVGGEESVSPIAADLAVDGVDEVFDTMVGMVGTQLPERAIELHALDTGDRWVVGDGEPVGSATGTAHQLLVNLWKRAAPTTGLALDGDEAAVHAALQLQLTP